MAKLSTYLGDIHYRDADGKDVSCRGAVLCNGREDFDATIEAHLQEQGASFLWSEEVHEALGWFNKFGHNGLMAGLAKKVDKANSVALSDPKTAHDEEPEDENYLIIEEIKGVEPLDMQMGIHPKLTVPAALQEAMFGQPEPTEAERTEYGDNTPPMGTYAILDGAKMPYLLTAELRASGLEHQSLFQGQAQEELGEHAPYIVRLEDGNDFTRKLFTDLKPPLGLWEKELGIFIRSRASLASLRKHFRKFTKVQDEHGKWYYFRFWEGASTAFYLSNIVDNELKINRMFNSYITMILVIKNVNKSFTRPNKTKNPIQLEPFIWDTKDQQIMTRFAELRFVENVIKKIHDTAITARPDAPIRNIVEKTYSFIKEQSYHHAVKFDDCVKLSLLIIIMGDYDGKITRGEILRNTLSPISVRIDLAQHLFIVAMQIALKKE